jgi:glycosyltransferase involved in cell wall biosynthesis
VKEVHFVVPDGIDDPSRPSGGNTYDRRLRGGLIANGWSVREHALPGPWPVRDPAALAALDAAVERIPDDAVALLDGLVASTSPEVLVPQARRLRLVVLVHMPLGHRPPDGEARAVRKRERAVLSAAAAVVTTSAWSAGRLAELYGLPAGQVHVAEPGSDPAAPATGSAAGEELLCVAAVSVDKGHDVLLDALTAVKDLSWQCACVGSLDREPAFVEALRRCALDSGLDGRVHFPGPRTGADLDRSYAGADVLVLASRAETYGMAVTEALARGLPVIAADVGGVTEALGRCADGARPGLLVPVEDAQALAAALRSWLGDAELRAQLRRAAGERRQTLAGWSTTTTVIAHVLAGTAR